MENNVAGFGVGQVIRYKEDDRFLTGAGRFQDEIIRPGQLLSSSFMDYAFPWAKAFPSFNGSLGGEILYPTKPPDIKGAGEAGTICILGTVTNELIDALAPLGLNHADKLATTLHVWHAIQAAKARWTS